MQAVQATSSRKAPVVLWNSGARHFSSVVPDYRHDDDDHSTESYSQNREALQKLLTASSTAASSTSTSKEQLNDTPTNDGAVQAENDAFKSPNELTYTGGATIPVTSDLHIVTPQEDTPRGVWPIFRIMVRESSLEAGSSLFCHKFAS